ncbi:MAG: hypothetical protein ACYC1D_02835 [Acidimicrobiales bacterium]
MSWLIRWGVRQGWERGVREGNRAWVVIGGLALLGRLAHRYGGRKTDLIFLEKLGAGESLRIIHESAR